MWLLIGLITLFTIVSTGMKSYLVMHLPLGPWVGPLFEVVCMVLLIPFISKKWFEKHAIMTIVAASIGGMIGMCLGMIVPSFYFLHKIQFLQWLSKPLWFAGAISVLVFAAGALAFLIAYVIKDHLITQVKLPFAMSKLVYDMVCVNHFSRLHALMWTGVGVSSIWNICMFVFRAALPVSRLGVLQLFMVPTIVSAGFIVGDHLAIPFLIGWFLQAIVLQQLHHNYFYNILNKEFLVMFCLGMLTLQILHVAYLVFMKKVWHNSKVQRLQIAAKFNARFFDPKFLIKLTASLALCAFVLNRFDIHFAVLLLVLPILVIASFNIARLLGEIGVVDIDGFLWCVLLPIMYGFTSLSSENILIIALFAALVLGIVIDLIFSYKIADLAGLSYRHVLTYQLFGFLVAVICSGLFMSKYAASFGGQSLDVFAFSAQDLDAIIQFGSFNPVVFILGMLCAVFVIIAGIPLLVVVGSMLMNQFVVVCLIIASAVSYFVPNKAKLYPMWFGLYAAHAVWMIFWSVV
jgi:hypothetical protein